ncbi:hypothetical protein OZX67_09140 [Bifidobacterium sp. ESL0728]|uniref:hypothetical protein n=1 Tax=Bifidobacterium sp. ESL0728 TaxID=2983220 RepID=UPI0023F79D65|nr:hypothetical protein [Bifidobacterium sp. ESL0728]WEV58934.1 hypothetical protein OZX67_09140 [Bifidobacterium sp. ESL0728]
MTSESGTAIRNVTSNGDSSGPGMRYMLDHGTVIRIVDTARSTDRAKSANIMANADNINAASNQHNRTHGLSHGNTTAMTSASLLAMAAKA